MAPRASASDVTIQVQLLSVTGSLYALAKTPDSGGVRLTSVCPTCSEGGAIVKTTTAHVCPSNHGPFAASDVLKAAGSGKAMKLVGQAGEVKAAKAEANDGPGKTINLSAYPASLVADATFPIGTPWVFQSADAKNPAINLLRESIDRDGHVATDSGDVVLLGEVQLRTDAPPKLVTLRTKDGYLLVQEMARPENMNKFDPPVDGEVAGTLRDQFSQILGASVADFKVEEHQSTSVQRFAEFITERVGEGVLALSPPADEIEAQEQDLETQLAAMLAAAKA